MRSRVGDARGERLLDERRYAGLQGAHGVLGVRVVGREDEHRVEVRSHVGCQQLVEGLHEAYAVDALRRVGAAPLGRVADDRDAAALAGAVGVLREARPQAEADDADAEVLVVGLLGHCGSFAFRSGGSSLSPWSR